MKKLLGIVVLGLLWCGTANATHTNKHYNKQFNITCAGEEKIYATLSGKESQNSFIQDIKVTIDIDNGKKIIGSYKMIDTDSWWFRPGIALWPNDDNIYNIKVKFDDKNGRIKLSSKKINKALTKEWIIEDYSERLNLSTGILIWYLEAKNTKSGSLHIVRSKAVCAKAGEAYAFLTGGGTGSNQGSSSGTAFFINKKGYLLTNNHVVEGCSLSKISYNNKNYNTKLISTDRTLDLALLKAEIKPKSYISFSNKEPKKRQQIIIAGYPLGKGLSDDLKINDGRISALKGFENNSNEITVDIAINPGNSGGPIVNQKGQLVAIAVSGMSKDVTEGINFGIKASAAKNFLKSNKISPSAGYLNFSMGEDEIVELLEESTVYTFCN